MKTYIQPITAVHRLEASSILCNSNQLSNETSSNVELPYNPTGPIGTGDGSNATARNNFWEY